MKVMGVVLVALALAAAAWPQTAGSPPSDRFPTPEGDLVITFIGHGTLMLQLGALVIHVDPVGRLAAYASLPKADVVLITHEHGDHLDPATVDALRKPDTDVVANAASAAKLPGARAMANGEAATLHGVRVEAIAAYNLTPGRTQYHPKGNGNGYLLILGEKRVYIAGDTENIPEMKALKDIDIAFLPMNLPYTMTPEQVADAAQAFVPRVLYPYHYAETNVDLLRKLLAGERRIDLRIRPMQ